ncbi:3-oxoacyl-reductase [Pseudomassariella vexata]|uniref:3-oxoacyl-reductase n=1 Tax=Pseudomassariella vexata TaxID=1141098 RepID=A0A1Y2DYV1_9PEZI|nr:3-oxoacyl-reductase [Pseudomassariella vexata]ORY64451.1 3-oxoacyl-reductase [Pseudomassariella vexata]
MPKTAVVTGANSGIGYEFAKLLINEGYDVFAVDLNAGSRLQSLGCKASQIDIASDSSIENFAKRFGDQPLDLLLNIAGVMESSEFDTLETINHRTLTSIFAVNAFGPLLLTQALLPNLLKSENPKVGVMSSRVGSIADNTTGGLYAYRSSKAALNALCKNLAVDLRDRGVTVVIMHPGFVKTEINPSVHELKQAVEADEAAEKLWEVMKGKGIESTGKFWHREGYELPW